ncbi:MAG: hypothetical protein PHY94_06740 [Candidatus Omnitrophica bacterium]|nr:hypothetical protein [Candidatus Omnitrophota bacterium]
MRKNFLKLVLLTVLMISVASVCFAAATKSITVTANVPGVSSALNVTVSQVNASNNVFLQSGPNVPVDFGTLTLDPVNSIFTSQFYYAVDIGVNNNTGTNWTLTHTANSIQKDATNNLDGNVNVTFVKQTTPSSGTVLQKVSYANSNNVALTSTQLTGAFLRIYYGIGTGSGDATGVLPITTAKPSGTYAGTVVITLTP